MPEFVRRRCIAPNEAGKAVSRSRILFIGMAYKKDLGDCRESPAIKIAEMLIEDKAELLYHDPHVDEVELKGRSYRSKPLTEDLLTSVDLVVIATEHSCIDYEKLVKSAPKILDTRDATSGITGREGKVVLL